MNMNQELNFVEEFPTEWRATSELGVVKSGQGLLDHLSETTRYIGARMWCQMSKSPHTFMSG